MSTDIYVSVDKCLNEKNYERALELCVENKQYYLGLFIGRLKELKNSRYYELMTEISKNTDTAKSDVRLIRNDQPLPLPPPSTTPRTRVQLLCNWCSSEDLAKLWNKMSKGNYIWNDIQIVWSEPVDYYVVINSVPANVSFDKKKTIVFRMEPHMSKHPEMWKEWANPDSQEFLKVYKHETGDFNNNEWHLSKTYTELSTMVIEKKKELNTVLSTILSGQYRDIGHVKRVDFVKFLEQKGFVVHVFGDNKWQYVNYKGSLPKYCKDDGIFPYKYVFNAENHAISNYFTEKLIDGILGECLTFYWGCPTVKEFIDERAYVQLELSNFERDYDIIKKAIAEDWHTQRLPYIREAKKKILNELQFFPRVEKLINNFKNKEN